MQASSERRASNGRGWGPVRCYTVKCAGFSLLGISRFTPPWPPFRTASFEWHHGAVRHWWLTLGWPERWWSCLWRMWRGSFLWWALLSGWLLRCCGESPMTRRYGSTYQLLVHHQKSWERMRDVCWRHVPTAEKPFPPTLPRKCCSAVWTFVQQCSA